MRLLLFSGEDWQIFSKRGGGRVLVTRPELAKKWVDTGFLDDSMLASISFGPDVFRTLTSPEKYALAPVENAKAPDSKADAIAFSISLKESRKLLPDASFHDAIYVEQFSRMLPTWTLTPEVEDEVVLGTWITGGVVVSTKSFRRLSNLTGWMPSSDLADILKVAGFNAPIDAGLLSKGKAHAIKHLDEQSDIADEVDQVDQDQPLETKTGAAMFTLPGRPYLETFFNEHIIDIIFNPEKYQALGINFPSAIVLYGPPGCGKTFAVERLIEFIDWPNYSISSGSVGSPFIHDTSKKISEVFDKAIDGAPSVIVIDEMESFLSDRGVGGGFHVHHVEEVAEFLRRIPEAVNNRVLIIAMTNMIEMIDPAILRRGRFDHIIEVGMPSRDEVASLLSSLLSKLPKSGNLNLDAILNALTGKPLSDAAFVVREAARLAAKSGKSAIDQGSINAALTTLPDGKEKKGERIGFATNSKRK
jgi:Cdc6-like AAA superfamily ATPase